MKMPVLKCRTLTTYETACAIWACMIALVLCKQKQFIKKGLEYILNCLKASTDSQTGTSSKKFLKWVMLPRMAGFKVSSPVFVQVSFDMKLTMRPQQDLLCAGGR